MSQSTPEGIERRPSAMNDSFSSIRTEKCSRKLENELEFRSGEEGGGIASNFTKCATFKLFSPPSLTLAGGLHFAGRGFSVTFPAGDCRRRSPGVASLMMAGWSARGKLVLENWALF